VWRDRNSKIFEGSSEKNYMLQDSFFFSGQKTIPRACLASGLQLPRKGAGGSVNL